MLILAVLGDYWYTFRNLGQPTLRGDCRGNSELEFRVHQGMAILWTALGKWWADLLFAVAICLKPQVGLCFLLFYVTQRRWRVAWVASALCGLVAVIAGGRLLLARTPWLSSYVENSRQVFAPGAINDFTLANPLWFHLINLQGDCIHC